MGKPKKKTKTGKKGSAGELLVVGWLESQGFTCHKAAATGMVKIGPRWTVKSHDLFGCIDIIAIRKLPYGPTFDPVETWAVQVTTDGGRSKRRRKIEALSRAWPGSWKVSIISHVTEPAASNKRGNRRNRHFMKVEDYVGEGVNPDGSTEHSWSWREPIEFDAKKTELDRKARNKSAKAQKRAKLSKPKVVVDHIEPVALSTHTAPCLACGLMGESQVHNGVSYFHCPGCGGTDSA